jgi:formate hydrogenlyase subunit 4
MTEYSGFRWSLYFLAEYANMIIVAGIATTLFLGGWLRPFASYHDHLPGTPIELLDALPSLLVLGVALYCFFLAPKQPVKIQKLVMVLVGGLCLAIAGILAGALFASPTVLQGVHGAFWFMAKVLAYLYCFLWFRFTFPRYRFDQLMRLGWRFLIPLALVNLITMATALLISREWGWSLRITSEERPGRQRGTCGGRRINGLELNFVLFLRRARGGLRDLDGDAAKCRAWRGLFDYHAARHGRSFSSASG